MTSPFSTPSKRIVNMGIEYYRELSDGHKIPVLGLGTWQLNGSECKYAVRKALELGYRHIDTAERYWNQPEIGEAIKDFDRSSIFLTSKVWRSNLHYDDVVKSCDRTLRELNTSYLDLYLIHWPNSNIPIRETFKALGELVSNGKVRSVGVSNFTISLLKDSFEASDVPVTVDQVEFNPYSYEKELLEFCNDNKVIVTAYSPLGSGSLIRDRAIVDIANRHDKTPAQICLRWCLQKGTVVIPRSGSEEHLKENTKIFDWEISEKDMTRIDSLNRGW